MSPVDLKNKRIDTINLSRGRPALDVLRLDLLHPVISGNKWFKLKKYLEEARSLKKQSILTFGGAYSNHLVATAAAARKAGFQSIGLVRGERPAVLSPSLQDALGYGMQLHFLSRADYQRKLMPETFSSDDRIYVIDEGGYGAAGVDGAKDILAGFNTSPYSHIVSAVGTGTTLAGLIKVLQPHQNAIGISVFKNNLSLQQEIIRLLNAGEENRFELLHGYHFGGYAKAPKALIHFMNEWFRQTGIPSDFVYTAKLFYAVNDLLNQNFFGSFTRLLLVHTGGLQGNRSLPKGTLIF